MLMLDPVLLAICSLVTAMVGGFAAAFYTNARTDARDEKKLEHDAEQKDRDRLLSLKKDIYFLAIGDFARVQMALGTLANTPLLSLQTSLPTSDFAANYARLELVAPLALVREIHKVSQEVRETFMPLMIERTKFQMKTEELKETKMVPTQAILAWDTHNREHSDFRLRCMEGSLKIRSVLVPAVREIRRELDMSVDMREFEALLQRNVEHAEGVFRRFQESLCGHHGANP